MKIIVDFLLPQFSIDCIMYFRKVLWEKALKRQSKNFSGHSKNILPCECASYLHLISHKTQEITEINTFCTLNKNNAIFFFNSIFKWSLNVWN